jgi:hypothetical protein
MGSGRGHQQEQNLQNQSQAAINTAAQVNPLQQQQQDRLMKFNNDWDSGKDVSQIDYLKPYFNLYNNASKDTTDQAGVGLLGNNALAGSNGRLATLIGEQQKSRRQEDASGQLYNAANQARADATGEGNVISAADTNQRMGVADLSERRYTNYLNRPRQTPFWQTLLQGGMMAAGAAGY